MRKKPTPSPLPRATTVRGLVAEVRTSALPTVAALLAATSMLACSSAETDITADRQVLRTSVAQVATDAPTTGANQGQPGMGALEADESTPNPRPIEKPVIKPVPTVPTPAGGIKPIAPVPTVPKMAGKIAPVHPTT